MRGCEYCRIDKEIMCRLCKRDVETMKHLLKECKILEQIDGIEIKGRDWCKLLCVKGDVIRCLKKIEDRIKEVASGRQIS